MNKQAKENYVRTFTIFMKEHTSNLSIGQMIDILEKLHFYESRLSNLNTQYANGDIQEEEHTKKTASIEAKVKIIADQLGFKVDFQNDPRGAAIMFYLPSKTYNSWDGESWRLFW
jgi:hypothetical protein